jgi:hypothetical protein
MVVVWPLLTLMPWRSHGRGVASSDPDARGVMVDMALLLGSDASRVHMPAPCCHIGNGKPTMGYSLAS